MTKKEFIWLGIRFLGVIYLLKAIAVLIRFLTAVASVNTLFIHPQRVSGMLVRWSILGSLTEGLPNILLCLYLLFFGKWVLGIIANTSQLAGDELLQKQNYVEILIRFIGLRWVGGIFAQIIWVISRLLMLALINVSPTLAEVANHPRFESHFKTIKILLTPAGFGSILFSITISALLAWYFLGYGNFFINLLNRLWLGKNKEEA